MHGGCDLDSNLFAFSNSPSAIHMGYFVQQLHFQTLDEMI
jgi:hypothetical protein